MLLQTLYHKRESEISLSLSLFDFFLYHYNCYLFPSYIIVTLFPFLFSLYFISSSSFFIFLPSFSFV